MYNYEVNNEIAKRAIKEFSAFLSTPLMLCYRRFSGKMDIHNELMNLMKEWFDMERLQSDDYYYHYRQPYAIRNNIKKNDQWFRKLRLIHNNCIDDMLTQMHIKDESLYAIAIVLRKEMLKIDGFIKGAYANYLIENMKDEANIFEVKTYNEWVRKEGIM